VRGKYDLYGIVHHYGTKNGGHYISEVRDMHQPSRGSAESWYLCDDESVKGILEPELDSKSAYVLFYYKTNATQKATKN
jgi:ubiquitin C-terminal hydrolase